MGIKSQKGVNMSSDNKDSYRKALSLMKSISWLRSPGNNQYSAAFLSANGSVMEYGYEVTSEE